jgi:kinetochore protein NDC80
MGKNELQQTINKLSKDLEAEQQQMWNEELKYTRGKEALEAQLAEYHKLARKLKLIPKGAENSKGYNFEIKFNPEAGANCLVKYTCQVYAPLKELLNETDEVMIMNKALNKKDGSGGYFRTTEHHENRKQEDCEDAEGRGSKAG